MSKILVNIIFDILFQVPLILTVLGHGNNVTANIIKVLPFFLAIFTIIGFLSVFIYGATNALEKSGKKVYTEKNIEEMKLLLEIRKSKIYRVYNAVTDVSLTVLCLLNGLVGSTILSVLNYIAKSQMYIAIEITLGERKCDM